MALIVHGHKRALIGYDEFLLKCPACESHNWADIMVYSQYFHIYWIPMFPFQKNANIICSNCGLKRYDLPFEPSLFDNYYEVEHKFRHPWYTYSGVGVILFLIITVILSISI